jgi:hypothetical protein
VVSSPGGPGGAQRKFRQQNHRVNRVAAQSGDDPGLSGDDRLTGTASAEGSEQPDGRWTTLNLDRPLDLEVIRR